MFLFLSSTSTFLLHLTVFVKLRIFLIEKNYSTLNTLVEETIEFQNQFHKDVNLPFCHNKL